MIRIYDFIHELRITFARRRLIRHPSRVNARNFNNLILSRSAGQVARMESKIRTAV